MALVLRRSLLTSRTFEEEQVFTSERASAAERAQTDFTVAVQATSSTGHRAGHISGRDIWRVGAVASVEAALRLADGKGPAKTGVLSAAEAFPAAPFLSSLERLGAFTVTV